MNKKINKEIVKALENFQDEGFDATSVRSKEEDRIEEVGIMSEVAKKLYVLYLQKLYEKGEAIKQVAIYNPYATVSDYLRGLVIHCFKSSATGADRQKVAELGNQAQNLKRLLRHQVDYDFPKFKGYILIFKPNYTIWHNGKRAEKQKAKIFQKIGKALIALSAKKASGQT